MARSFITATLALALGVTGCMAPPRPVKPADIPAHWQVRNSPVPVPRPVRRPAPPVKAMAAAAAPVPTQPRPSAVDVSAITGTPAAVAPARSVTVQRGDTVYAISRRHGSDVRAIIAANNLTPPYILHPGMQLRLPGARVHVVARGETTYSISRRYGVDLTELAKVNGLRPPYTIHVGQRLSLPAAAADAASASGAVVQNNRGPLPPPPSRLGFAWPVQGRLLSSFGAKAGGLHNDGINVVADLGAPVVAADAGVVAYAGSDLRAFGNLVLVQHQGGWVTAYAHLDQVAVRRGQKLDRGQRLGTVGQTGGVTRPQLHFEIRQGRRAVDPMQHLPK